MPSWTATAADRLDAFLLREAGLLSRAKAQKAIEHGRVTVNGKVVMKTGTKLKVGDEVAMAEVAQSSDDSIRPVDLHLPILFEDASCIVIDKPAGIAVHPGAGMAEGEATILHGAAFLYKKWRLPFSPESVLVHRLDKETTGCMLIAKNPQAHLTLQKQFEGRTVDKRYLALVAGVPSLPEATIDAPIGRSPQNRTKMSVRASSASRQAKTTYRLLAHTKDVALLECELHTGRTHQVRVHLHSIGHPILGDNAYTSSQSEKISAKFGIEGVCLHAWKLSFESPADGKRQAVVAPVSRSFLVSLKNAGITLSSLSIPSDR